MDSLLVLGIERRCGETGAGRDPDGRLPNHAVASSHEADLRLTRVGAVTMTEAVADVLTWKAVAGCVGHGVDTRVAVDRTAAGSRSPWLAGEQCAAARSPLRIPVLWLRRSKDALTAAVADLPERAGSEPAPQDVPTPPAPLENAALHSAARGLAGAA
ncbi:hypothetical protein QQY24_00275 [Streptomyces sp. TG1A-8]|uniref:hypothetical protein n=1 Tax=Streptomyces sp. TG1A-8 TaxID=3051385 RepID=UPI00265BCFC1|nr:hypothetical protein [Streptomyces sp. TG1A-8]MDO0923925.1 hypothetical protein [Streptomyces sp. TG1A-8]MDO0923964.1 hypothetical protein [Streptomyces sp. TG1A-8]